jgi:hypothetical protein
MVEIQVVVVVGGILRIPILLADLDKDRLRRIVIQGALDQIQTVVLGVRDRETHTVTLMNRVATVILMDRVVDRLTHLILPACQAEFQDVAGRKMSNALLASLT